MTAVSNDIQAQPATRSATDRQAGRKDGGGFDDALKTSDKEQKLKAEKQPNDEIRWTRFGRKLDAAIAIGRGTTTEKEGAPDSEHLDSLAKRLSGQAEETTDSETGPEASVFAQSGLTFAPILIRRPASGVADAKPETPAGDEAGDPTLSVDTAASKGPARPSDKTDLQSALEGEPKSRKTELDRLVGRAAQTTADKTERPSETARADTAKQTVRATVLSEQSFPTPMPSTGMLLAEKIAAEIGAPDVAGKTQTQAVQTQTGTATAHALKIQLNPAELGIVTASLRFAGEQLSIEIQVENQEAYQRLSADSETIVKSLRGLGYEIDKVTIMQPNIAVNSPARAEAEASISNQAPRGGESSGSGQGNESGSRNPGGSGNDARQNSGLAPLGGRRESVGGGLYI